MPLNEEALAVMGELLYNEENCFFFWRIGEASMNSKRFFLLILIGVITVFSFSGCGQQKYRLNYDGYGFESKRTEYAAGDKVTVYFDLIATDTDYNFFIDDDVKMKQSYDNDHGYIFTFTMPEHDVTIHEEHHNSMEYIPEPVEIDSLPENEIAAELDESAFLFDYFREVVATVGGDGYDELVLYGRPNGAGLILAKYSKWGDDGERRRLCLVPETVLDDCLEAVARHDMRNWKDGFPITGARYVVKFRDGDELIRVSSEAMPEDGMAAFDEIGSILGAAWGEFGPKGSADDSSPIPPDGYGTLFNPDQPDSVIEPEPGNDEDCWFCPTCGRRNDGNYCMECGEKRP